MPQLAQLLHFTDEKNWVAERRDKFMIPKWDPLSTEGRWFWPNSFNIECLLCARHCLVLESQQRTECVTWSGSWGRLKVEMATRAGWRSRNVICQPSRCVSWISRVSGLGPEMTGAPVTMAQYASTFLAVCFRFGLGFYSSNKSLLMCMILLTTLGAFLSSLPSSFPHFLSSSPNSPCHSSFLPPFFMPSLPPSPLPFSITSILFWYLLSVSGTMISSGNPDEEPSLPGTCFHSLMAEAGKKTDHHTVYNTWNDWIMHSVVWGANGTSDTVKDSRKVF